jgi:hypothetical protein
MAERGDLADIPDQGPWEDDEGAPDEDAPSEDEAPEGAPGH